MFNFHSFKQLKNSILDSRHLDIRPDDFVIDVGCGANPLGRANLLVERFIGCSAERGLKLTPLLDRPAIMSDASKLPFKDNGVDFLVSRHMIEHLEEPEIVMEEFSRVAKRGMLQCPRTLWEKIRGFDVHRWFINVEDGVLVFREKERVHFDEEISSFFWEMDFNKDFQRFMWRNIHQFELIYEWSGSIRYKVHRNSGKMVRRASHDDPLETIASALRTAKKPPTFPKRIKSVLHRFIRERLDSKCSLKLEDVFACPQTHGPLEWKDDRLYSPEAGISYPIIEGVPVFTHTLADDVE